MLAQIHHGKILLEHFVNQLLCQRIQSVLVLIRPAGLQRVDQHQFHIAPVRQSSKVPVCLFDAFFQHTGRIRTAQLLVQLQILLPLMLLAFVRSQLTSGVQSFLQQLLQLIVFVLVRVCL